MRARILIGICLTVGGVGFLSPSSATAQVVIGGRGGMLVVPGVSIRIGGGVPILPAYGLPRRRWAGALYGVPPVAPPVGIYAQRRIAARQAAIDSQRAAADAADAAASDVPLPTAAELAAMADGELLNAVLGLSAQLDADLNRFSSAASWQRYLHLPEDALPPPENGRVSLGIRSLTAQVAKFDSVAANPNFAQIFSLPSFAATRMALVETTRRLEQAPAPQRAAKPALPAVEELPLPPVAPEPSAQRTSTPALSPTPNAAPARVSPLNTADGERSILLSK